MKSLMLYNTHYVDLIYIACTLNSCTGIHWMCVIHIQHVASVRVLVIASVDGALLKTGQLDDPNTIQQDC